MADQLLLPIHQIDDDTLENFNSDNNLSLLSSLQKNFEKQQQQFFYIWGIKSSGKTHLLKACSNYFFTQQRSAIYIPLHKSHYFSPAVLDGLENQELVCLDNLQSVVSNSEWELAIFDLFNRIKESGKTILLISANQSPLAIDIKLPDLSSRLSWGEIYQLMPLNEKQKIEVLQHNARGKGIELSDETANFLFKRLDRDLNELLKTLTLLDKASLQSHRKLTIPFVKEILHL
ncbi:regulatory inactivation of DnaA Hda protein [Bisgaardia hudsonensis]|uniref:Regulatory inactivation of DnaA Hda protein n=1 Tax=Bisgaardia hudsonensis TaxID=109472 RepID=A0A4R2N2G0_9PAST|nr:DnaA regulatory inactivator Hda [Bisgaardia hudsonensis]QLB12509.1 DnaA regulatory inactivator Hda [Bisgaardia hudsonensis]TCP14048.1 regulatory inactivation of DnaA Hda protein [Bisgaardia hudsonensis]